MITYSNFLIVFQKLQCDIFYDMLWICTRTLWIPGDLKARALSVNTAFTSTIKCSISICNFYWMWSLFVFRTRWHVIFLIKSNFGDIHMHFVIGRTLVVWCPPPPVIPTAHVKNDYIIKHIFPWNRKSLYKQ